MANGALHRTQRLAASPPLFDSAFLNFFSRVHPSIPAIVFIPVVVVSEWLAADRGLDALELIGLTLGGLAIWTLTEYWLHRLLFHWEPDNEFGRRMHFIIHGVHHDHPNDRLRLVMPPAVSSTSSSTPSPRSAPSHSTATTAGTKTIAGIAG